MLSRPRRLRSTRFMDPILDGVFTGLWFSLVLLALIVTCFPA